MSRGQKGNTMAKEWRIIVQEGDETKLDTVTSCFMVGVATGQGSRVVGGCDATVLDTAGLYLHISEKISDHQDKHPELREALRALFSLKHGLSGVDDD